MVRFHTNITHRVSLSSLLGSSVLTVNCFPLDVMALIWFRSHPMLQILNKKSAFVSFLFRQVWFNRVRIECYGDSASILGRWSRLKSSKSSMYSVMKLCTCTWESIFISPTAPLTLLLWLESDDTNFRASWEKVARLLVLFHIFGMRHFSEHFWLIKQS